MKKKSKSALNIGPVAKAKIKLRNEILACRKRISRKTLEKISAKIEKRLSGLWLYKNARVIMFFVSKAGEVNTHKMINKKLQQDDVVVVVPKVCKGKLLACQIKSFKKDLAEGKFGILEPSKDAIKVRPENIDVVIVPALAYDRAGYRLGYGGGYYDRFLQKIPRARRIGIISHRFFYNRLPRSRHDIPVGVVVTEKEIVNTQKQ